jgi:hypothetical protein
MTIRLAHLPLWLALLTLGATATAEPPVAAPAPAAKAVVFQDDFESGTGRWEMTDPKVWKVEPVEAGHALALTASSQYEPAVRSPKSIAWAKDLKVGDFELEIKLKQTGREYGHRDLCLFFGKQDASHFYYVHLASVADDHANSIFLVNGAPRVSIAKERTDGTKWTKGWHTVRLKRDTTSGRIEVYFDDMDTPVMIAEDKTFGAGAIGLGSFDDVGQFDDLKVWGK